MSSRIGGIVVVLAVVVGGLAGTQPAQAAFPGVSGKIAWSRATDGNVGDAGTPPISVFSMDPDGAVKTDLTTATVEDAYPAWSADGSLIAFASTRSGDSEIWVMSADGTGAINVTNSPTTVDRYPSWSPDGSRIAFTTNASCHVCTGGNIALIGADGTGLTLLTTGSFPSWSPSGDRIAFARDGDIFTIKTDGTDLVQLTTGPGRDIWPDWSPDGSQIVWWGPDNEIFVMDADGTDKINLTNSPLYDCAPAWSPDGSQIAFCRVPPGTGQEEIFVMDADGGNVVRLTDNDFYDAFPAWQPQSLPDVTAPLIDVASECSEAGNAPWCRGVVAYRATASDGESGLAPGQPSCRIDDAQASCSGTLTDGIHRLTVAAQDTAGNAASTSRSFHVDATSPDYELHSIVPTANERGWHRTHVTVSWTCSDGLSGVVASSIAATLAMEGADQSAFAVCEDGAGNSTTATRGGISIDMTPPHAEVTEGTLVLDGAITGVATDALSGVGGVVVTLTDIFGNATDVPAACGGCGSSQATWHASTEGLLPGLYEVDVHATDVAENIGVGEEGLHLLIL